MTVVSSRLSVSAYDAPDLTDHLRRSFPSDVNPPETPVSTIALGKPALGLTLDVGDGLPDGPIGWVVRVAVASPRY
jgi:hypothetical protein